MKLNTKTLLNQISDYIEQLESEIKTLRLKLEAVDPETDQFKAGYEKGIHENYGTALGYMTKQLQQLREENEALNITLRG